MTLDREVAFDLELALSPAAALEFVRDPRQSLARARFLRALRVDPGPPPVVAAELPVNVALFGERLLPFRSELVNTPQGARLIGRQLVHDGPGWVQLDGEAEVAPAAGGTRVGYRFGVRVHLRLPEPERWGGQALLHMIQYAAQTVLERVTTALPAALREAAREAGTGEPVAVPSERALA